MSGQDLNIGKNRQSVKYSRREIALRILWSFASPLYRLSPRPLFGWRCFLLRLFGARIGRNVHIYNSATIYFPWNLEIGDWSSIGEHAYIYNLGCVTIGRQVTISQHAHLCAGTHDYTRPDMPLIKPPITINDQVWICADAFVGPGVNVGEGAVLGARAVVTKDVGAWQVMVGNPARVIKERSLG